MEQEEHRPFHCCRLWMRRMVLANYFQPRPHPWASAGVEVVAGMSDEAVARQLARLFHIPKPGQNYARPRIQAIVEGEEEAERGE